MAAASSRGHRALDRRVYSVRRYAHALWTSGRAWRGDPLRGVAVLLSVPPIGIVGWAHPVTAAGILFPGWSWFGLAAAVIGLLVMTTRTRPIAILTLGALWIWSAANWTEPNLPHGWIAVDTKFGGSNGDYANYLQHLETIDRVGKRRAREHPSSSCRRARWVLGRRPASGSGCGRCRTSTSPSTAAQFSSMKPATTTSCWS
jgi:hypothetical protein